MKFKKLDINDVVLIEPIQHNDSRGFFMESFRSDLLIEFGIKSDFIQDNIVHSSRNVLRGLHYQKNNPQDKLIQVIEGEIFDVAVDIRPHSKTYGKWVGEFLNSDNKNQLYVPSGFAHGYCVISDRAIVHYKCSDYYYPNDQNGIIWNDKELNISWPIKNPEISEKDSKLPTLQKMEFI